MANDPRVTKMGRLLRITSVDEIPQLWNVVIGNMSLVGPRPIVQEEVTRYGDEYALFTQRSPRRDRVVAGLRPQFHDLWRAGYARQLLRPELEYLA